MGAAALGSAATLQLTDVTIRETVVRSAMGDFGRGLEVDHGAQASVSRAVLEGNSEAAVFAGSDTTTLQMEDVVLRDTRSRSDRGGTGSGLTVLFGAHVELTRAIIERNRVFGVAAASANTTVVLRSVVVQDILEPDCGVSSCTGSAHGFGVAALEDAAIDVEHFRVSRSALCGVALVRGGTVDLRDGEVTDNPIGVNIQTEGFDLQRVQDRVTYRGNERALDSSVLPVPDPGDLAR